MTGFCNILFLWGVDGASRSGMADKGNEVAADRNPPFHWVDEHYVPATLMIRGEYCKVCSMLADELKTYVSSWPWIDH